MTSLLASTVIESRVQSVDEGAEVSLLFVTLYVPKMLIFSVYI